MKKTVNLQEIDIERLVELLGINNELEIFDEPEFFSQCGCPEDMRETWIAEYWIRCDIAQVLLGQEKVGGNAVLLISRDDNGIKGRLIYPTKALMIANVAADGRLQMIAAIRSRPIIEVAAELITKTSDLERAYSAKSLTIGQSKLIWKAIWISFLALEDRGHELDRTQWIKLLDAMRSFLVAFRERKDLSPQGKYLEALLNSRQALRKNHNPTLDPYPELVEIVVEDATRNVADYVRDDIKLPTDKFLDALEMMARDGCVPESVANPPARVRAALTREQRRAEWIQIRRELPLVEDECDELSFGDPEDDRVIARIDLDRAIADAHLTEDQTKVLEAKLAGMNVQSEDAADDLELEKKRLAAVRRSLAPDRSTGKKLCRSLAAYRIQRKTSVTNLAAPLS